MYYIYKSRNQCTVFASYKSEQTSYHSIFLYKIIRHDSVAKHELPESAWHLPARHPEYCDAERGSGAFKIPMRIVGADQAGRRAWQLTIQQEMSTVLKV